MKKIAYLTWANAAQIRSFQDFSAWLDDMIYLRDLGRHDLSNYACVIVPDAMDLEALRPHAPALNAYLRSGGFLVSFISTHIADLIDVVDIRWMESRADDWKWWMKPGGRLEVYQPEPKHPICEVIPLEDMSWHWFGAFELRDDATSALNLNGDAGSLFQDFRTLNGGGRLIISTLDPHLHNGERFMPATTRFLNGFYPWLNRELGIDRAPRACTCTYLQTFHEEMDWRPDQLVRSFENTPMRLEFCPGENLTDEALRDTNILYIPNNHDEFFMRGRKQVVLDFLARGGHLFLNAEPVTDWLPFLKPFQPVPPRPFDNLKVRIRNDPFGFFQNMDDAFDGWKDVFGQYGRGWSPIPEGGIWLTDIGPADDPHPIDWLWKYPMVDGKGGYVFMHNGDSLVRYPDHGSSKDCLVRDICLGLMRAASGASGGYASGGRTSANTE